MTRKLEIKQPFNLELSLTMGQAFRWRELGDGWFSGVLGENLVHVRQTDDGVEYRVGGPEGERDAGDADDAMLRKYFREDEDISAIYAEISRDPHIADLVEQYPGMRVLRQDAWECLVSYIFSQTAAIPTITKSVEKLAVLSRCKVGIGNEKRHVFPTAEQVVAEGLPSLEELRFGLNKARNTLDAAQRICVGALRLDELAQSDTDCRFVIRELDDCPGVGPKIANCVALMGLDKLDAFPVDRWILRALENGNYEHCPLPPKSRKYLHDGDHRKLHDWAEGYFGKYAGCAGQYLFHAIEPNK